MRRRLFCEELRWHLRAPVAFCGRSTLTTGVEKEAGLPVPLKFTWLLAAVLLAIQPGMANEALTIEQRVLPEQSVGSLKQGIVCLPAGKIYASQLRTPTAAMVSDAMVRAGHSRPPGLKYWGVITDLNVSLCTSWMGIAKTKPKGKISVDISWSLEAPGDRVPSCTANAKISLDGDDPRISERPMTAAIIASFAEAERCIANLSADPARPS